LIVFDEPDHIGHSVGHNTTAYYEKLAELDGYIGSIEQAVKDAGIYENTVFIFSSDHGGINRGHGGNTPEERQIPFILSGKNIRSGYIITTPVRIYDIAPTIAAIFNIPIPSAWIGEPIQDVFIE
jgi:arylsulfatase A-like enzyme